MGTFLSDIVSNIKAAVSGGGSSGGSSGGGQSAGNGGQSIGGLQLGAGFDFKGKAGSDFKGKAGSGKATTDESNPSKVRATIGRELVSSGLKKMEQANKMQSLVDTAKQTRGLMLGQWGDSREGAALTNRELTGDRGEDSAVEDEESIFSKTAQPKETTTGKVDSTVRPTAAALRPTAAALTPEQRQERKEEVRQQNAQLEQDYRELNSKILYGRIGRDYTEEDIERLNNLETQIQDNRDELKALQADVRYGPVLGLNTMTGFERAGLGVTKMLDWLVGEGSIPWGLATETATLFGTDLEGKNPVSALKRQGEQEVQGWASRATAAAEGNDVAEMIGQHTQSISESLPFVVLNLMSMGTAGMATAAGQTAGLQYTAALNSSPGMKAIGEMSRYGLKQLAKDPGAQYSFISSFGENYEDAIESGASEIEATLYAAVNSSYNAMIEVGGSDEGLGGMQMLPKEVREAIQTGKSGIVMDWVKSVGQEIGEEELQGIMERGLKQIYTDVPTFSTTDENAIFNPQVMKDTALNTAIDTAIMGGVQTGINTAALRAEQNRAKRAEREGIAKSTNDAARAEEAARAAAAYQEEQSALLLAAQEHEAEAARARAAGAYQEEQDQLRLAGQARAEAEAKARAADAYQEEQNALLEAVQAREQAEELQKQAQAYQEEQDALRLAQQETERRNGDVEEDEQVTAETESGLLEQEEAQQGEGEQPVRAGEADEDRAGTAAGTETAIRLAGEDLSDGSGRWDAGQRAGGEAGQLDRDAGTGSRDQGAGGSGRARTGESYGDALRKSGARQLSSREFGLERGTDTPTFYEITEDLLTDDLKQLRYGIGTSTGCSVEFVSGPMQVVGRDGRVQNIGGFYDPANRRIVVRADGRRYTAEQIARHEEFHALADLDPHLVDEIRDRITERFGRKEMERIVRGYQIARRGINDITSGVDAEAREAQELLEEIFADANGNMNAFGLGANRFAFNTWTTITNRENRRSQTANGTKTTRGPPRYTYAGEQARTANMETLQQAKELEEADVDNETIRQQTGWFRGMDGKWRFEISDGDAEYSRAGDVEFRKDHPEYAEFRNLLGRFGELSEEEMSRLRELHETWNDEIGRLKRRLENGSVPLNQVLDHPALFRAYPELKETRVQIRETDGGVEGGYNPADNTITISKNARDNLSTLLHEAQHAIQEIEGFTRGASTEYWMDRNAREQPELDARMEELRESARSIREELDGQRAQAGYDEFVDQTYALADQGSITEEEAERRIQQFEEEHAGLRSLEKALDAVFREMQDIRGQMRTAADLYRSTAGEIEARDVQDRLQLGEAERRATEPNLGDENTVFAEGSGTSYDIKYPKYTDEEMKNNSLKLQHMDIVKEMSGGEFSDHSRTLYENVLEFFNSLGNYVHSEEFGDVALTPSSVRSDIRHGTTREKIVAYAAIPEVIQNGKVIYHIDKGRGLERIVTAAPIRIGKQRYFMAVMLQRDPTSQRLYAHDVIIAEEFTSSSGRHLNTNRAGSEGDKLFITDILQNALSVKQSFSVDEEAGLDEIQRNAMERFGITDDFAEAGYILPNGEMLRFTDDGHSGSRDYDHGAIAAAYGEDVDLNKNHGFDEKTRKYLERFVEDGSIRFDAGDMDLNMDAGIQMSGTKPITREQEQTIREFIRWKQEREESYRGTNDSLYDGPLALRVEFGGDAGVALDANPNDLNAWGVKHLSYEGGQINEDRIIQDIRHYYQTGELRKPSELARFRYSVEEDEDRSGWNEDFRKRVEDTEELIDDLQEFYQSVDEYDENRLSQEELENYTDYNRYSRNVSMYGGSEITDSLNELAKDATGERRTEIFELMERMLPHLDELEQQRYTGDRNDPEWQPTAFSRWYNKRHPSLYYPGYQPGDLFDRGKADSWTAWDNQDREKEYLQGLIDSGKLMEPELTEAREFLERLENGSEVFYSTDDGYDPDYVQQVLDAAEERDALQERLNRIESRDGRYVDRESGTEFDEAEVRELAEALEAAENRYNELAAEAENHRTEETEENEEEEPEEHEEADGSLRLGEAEETEETRGQTALPEDPKDRTIRELEAANRDLQKYADNWRKQASITGEGEETAKRSDVRRFTNELADEAEYQGERAELQQKVQRLSDMVVSNDRGDGLDWNEIRRQAREIAEDLVDNSYTVMDPEADTRKAILSDLKQMKIRPDREWTSDFGDWNSMRQRLVGKIIFNAKEGRSIDDVYQELRASYGEGLFPENITAGSDQLNRIIDALDQLRPSMNYNFASDQDAEMATQYYQNKITDEVLYGNIGPELTKADRNYRRVKERMRDAEQKLREVKKESRQKIEDLQKMQRHEVRAAVENQRKQVREREEKQKLRKKISQTGKRLIKYLTENNGQKNPIPEPLKEAVGKVLLDLDISGGMDVKQKKKYVQDMQQVARIVTQQNAYMEGNTDKWAGMYLDLPADIQQELDEHLQNVQKAMDEAEAKGKVWNPNMMGTEELQRLDEILTVLTSAITNSNEILSDARGAKISEEAAEGIREIDSLGTDRKRSERGESLNKFLRFQNTTPYYFFKRLGKAGMRMFERIQDGWDKFALNARQVVDFANETYTEQEAREIQETVYEFQLRRRGDMSEGFEKPETVRMTKAQIMSLYCLWKREQARGHLTGAGIRIADFRDGKNKITQAENYLLDMEDIAKITGKLTERDREIADALQKYMNTVGSDWGNEVSMKRFGIRSFTEENYFPITTDDRTRPVRNPESDTANLYRLLNMSFTKSTQRGASNSVVIDNIFDVFANHMADMAKYNGLGLPMLDAMKWVSYNQTSELNEEGQYGYESVQKSMERAFGKEARTYFTTFMKDLNGVREGGRGEEFGSRMLSSYKVAAVGANIRVALLQPTSYVRAGAVLDKKYLVRGLGMSNKQGQEEARKWSGTAVWKDLGFYDTNINAGLREMIKHTDGLKGKIQEASMKGAELGDKMTWGALWNACKAEQTDRGFTGDELMQKTAERFREVVYRTQVMDSTMTRSHVMRQKGAYAGMVTAFMSEPTLSYNMLLDAYTEYENEVRKEAKGSTDKATLKKAREKAWEKAGPAVGKAATAYLATATLSAIVESVIDAARDDDEYANFLERFAEKLLGFNVKDPDSTTWEKIKGITSGNLMQDLLVHNKLPVVKDFFSILSGNDTSRMDTEWMNNIIRAGQIAWESLALRAGWIDEPTKITYNGNMTAWGKIYNILRGVSQVTGLPLGNAMRDLSAMWNSTVGEITGKKIQTYDPGPLKQIQYALKDGYITEDDAVKLLMEKELVDDEIEARQQAYVWANPEKYENMLAAMRAGDKEGFEAAKDQLEDLRYKQSSIMAAVTSEVKEMYLGTDGTEPISREEAMSLMMEYGGMIERKAETEIQKWTCELETGIPYDGIDEAYIAGDITREQAEKMLVEYGGYAEDKAAAQVQKWTSQVDEGIWYSEIDDYYFYGDITYKEAVDMYMKYGGMDRETAENTVLETKFLKDFGRERDRIELQDMYVSGEYDRDKMKEIMLEYGYSANENSAENSLIRWDFIGDDMSLDKVTPTQAKAYFNGLEDAEIDKHTYLDFATRAADIKADYDENGKSIMYSKMDKVLALIDSLDLSDEQKDALALIYGADGKGYAEKNLSRAPWHEGSTKKSTKKSGGRSGGGGGGRKKSRSSGGGGGGLSLPAVEAVDSGRGSYFDDILDQWRKRKLTRAEILKLLKEGKLTQKEADQILATLQEGDEAVDSTDRELLGSGLQLGAAEDADLLKEP